MSERVLSGRKNNGQIEQMDSADFNDICTLYFTTCRIQTHVKLLYFNLSLPLSLSLSLSLSEMKNKN